MKIQKIANYPMKGKFNPSSLFVLRIMKYSLGIADVEVYQM